MGTKRDKGGKGEQFAVAFLERIGFTVLERNYVFAHGEIDIVAKEEDELVFVEVKTRYTRKFGAPEEAVTPAKQALVRRTAEGYVEEHHLENVSCRFDVVAIQVEHGEMKPRHFKDAF